MKHNAPVYYKRTWVGSLTSSRRELVNNIAEVRNQRRLAYVTRLLILATIVAVGVLTILYIYA